jgi:hypothetical protein
MKLWSNFQEFTVLNKILKVPVPLPPVDRPDITFPYSPIGLKVIFKR